MKPSNFQLIQTTSDHLSRDTVVSSPNRLRNSLEQQNSKLKMQIGQLEDALKKMGVNSQPRPPKQSAIPSDRPKATNPHRPFELVYGENSARSSLFQDTTALE